MATPSNPNERVINFLKAQLADGAGRHDHTVRFMMEIAKSVSPAAELSRSERQLLYIALNKFLGDHREAWYKIQSMTINWVGIESEVAKFYLKRIADEILNVGRQFKHLIARYLIPSAQSAEARVSYLTFKGNVSSYMVVLKGNAGKEDEELAAILAYREANAIAKARLTWLSPARLTLAVNMSEFYTEVVEWVEKGVKIAGKALQGLENAINAGDNLPEGELKEEINELMEQLRENITAWADIQDEDDGTSPSRGQLGAGTSTTQVASPYEIGKKAGPSGTQPAPQPKAAPEEAGTSETRAALQPEPCAEAGTSKTRRTPPT